MIEKLRGKKIGIWGYGVVGKAAYSYAAHYTSHISLFDQKTIINAPATLRVYLPHALENFLEENDLILVSPGVDLRNHAQHAHKFIAEFDLFRAHWHKPIVAITGSIGKTTITHLLSQILEQAGMQPATGGNIGTAMLDLLTQQNAAQLALLELSSFQLEVCTTAAPDIAVITNIYHNHLDRHGTFENYCAAKFNIFAKQTTQQQALLTLALAKNALALYPHHNFSFFSSEKPDTHFYAQHTIYYLHNNTIFRYAAGTHQHMATLTPAHPSFANNWLIIYAVLAMLGMSDDIITHALPALALPEHRVEFVANYKGIQFYNDSKSTVPEATYAAVQKLAPAPIILFLGGIARYSCANVNRATSIAQLKNSTIKYIICFGKEAAELARICAEHNIAASPHTTLEEAFAHCMQNVVQPGDVVLLSPAGASFDLFSSYQERGEVFKKLVRSCAQ